MIFRGYVAMKDYGSALITKIILSILSLILPFPCYWELSGTYHALTGKSPTTHKYPCNSGLSNYEFVGTNNGKSVLYLIRGNA
jgi:hypothetical protein